MPYCEFARQPDALHLRPGVAKFLSCGLLVAQFFPHVHSSGNGNTPRHAPTLTSRLGIFPTLIVPTGRYAKAIMVRKQLADVLAQKIAQGQYDEEMALTVARQIFFETPQSLCGMKPKVIRAQKNFDNRTGPSTMAPRSIT